MQEMPVIFNTRMVAAILGGYKSTTCRVIKLPAEFTDLFEGSLPDYTIEHAWAAPGYELIHFDFQMRTAIPVKCPYFIRQHLWVKETWATEMFYEDGVRIKYKDDTRKFFEIPEDKYDWHENEWPAHDDFFHKNNVQLSISSEFDYEGTWILPETGWPIKWRPSIFMPRFVSRILLEVTSVDAIQIQDLTTDDIIAEGITEQEAIQYAQQSNNILPENWDYFRDKAFRNCFIDLWNSINAKRGYPFDVNPWVWKIGIKLLKASER